MVSDSKHSQREWPLFYSGEIRIDERGTFRELFSSSILKSFGEIIPPMQQTNSIVGVQGSIRGFHAHRKSWKVLSCLTGEILEVFLDLRKESKDFGKSFSIRISQGDGIVAIIPPEIAHAFQVTSPEATIVYASSTEYLEGSEIDINPQSVGLKNFWSTPLILSERDSKSVHLNEFLSNT
jgi:dTDP-4-dehydrorhamnose 3,5-epimerase